MPWNRLERLVSKEYRRLFLLALAITADRGLAEDAVHDALVAVVEGESRPRKLSAYVATAVRNRAYHLVRIRSRHVSEPEIFDALVAPRSPESEALTHQVNEAMRLLSTNEREAICLHLYGGMRFREIAEWLEVPLGTVTSWYRRGLTKLNREVNDEIEDRETASDAESRRA